MSDNLPKQVLELFAKFNQAGYQLYIVGGAVRDLLMKREVKDWDFTTDATPEEILKVIPEGFYNNQFGTVGLKSELGIFEITTMRKETGYSDFRHPSEVSWTKDINEDLSRRDFTVNAMALDANEIIDPFGGQIDLSLKQIKAVGDPGKRFHEDALRLMRAIRFATQLNFNIEEKTLAAMKQSNELIKKVSWERTRNEFLKILSADDPLRGVVMLRDTDILQIILPELERCFGVVQEGPKHDREYDIGEHSLLSLKHCPSKDPVVRFATLIHDIGKPDTFDTHEDGNVTFYGHDVVGSKIARNVSERFKFSKKEIEKISKLVRWHMYTVTEHQTDSAIRRFIKNVGLENIEDMLALRIGDRLGGGTEKAVSWRMEEFRKRIDQVLEKPFSISDLKVNGKDVMDILGIKTGPKVGEVLNNLFKEVLVDSEKNNREYLMEQIKSQKSG
jgi:tRNA nucleotidyltransferase (CCA-adding enzyme)